MNKSSDKKIGILGGSFDPPHDGHKFISQYALMRLNLHEVWWVVTHKNPFKIKSNSYDKRIKQVQSFMKFRRIKILEIREDKNIYAIDTILYIKNKFKHKNFIWLMGTDNLKKLHEWKRWKKIFYNIPIAIFDRPPYSLNITKSKALFFFRKARIKNILLAKSRLISPQCWTFISGLKNHLSSSNIRNSE